jgi:hypothetical protein
MTPVETHGIESRSDDVIIPFSELVNSIIHDQQVEIVVILNELSPTFHSG